MSSHHSTLNAAMYGTRERKQCDGTRFMNADVRDVQRVKKGSGGAYRIREKQKDKELVMEGQKEREIQRLIDRERSDAPCYLSRLCDLTLSPLA